MSTAQILLLVIKAAIAFALWIVSLPGERSKLCQFAWWEVQAMSVCLVIGPSYVSLPGERSKLCQFAWWEVHAYLQPTPHTAGLSACLVRGPSLSVLDVRHMSLYSLKSHVYHNFSGYWQMNAFNILSCLHDYRWQIWQILVKEIKEITWKSYKLSKKKSIQLVFHCWLVAFQCWGIKRSNGQKIRGKQQHKLPPILCTVTSLILQLLSPSYLVMHILSYADPEEHIHTHTHTCNAVCISAVSVLHNMSLSVH